MANTFKNSVIQNIGASWQSVYTCPASTKSVVIGMSVSNKLVTDIDIQIRVNDGSTTPRIVAPSTPIPYGSSLVPLGGITKLVLDAGDEIEVLSSDALSSDAIVSVLEIS